MRGTGTPERAGRFEPVVVTRPYVYGASTEASRPQVPTERRARQPRQVVEQAPDPVAAQETRLSALQETFRPLTVGELLPGLWVERIVESRAGNYSRPGLLAADRREPDRIVLWTPIGPGRCRSHFVLGPGHGRDDSLPMHEVWPIDPEFFPAEVRNLLSAFADRAVYNRSTGEFEISA
ncbi:hypothetical protein ACWEDZ_38410 [Streptomyces sp. NPDC005047]